MAIFKLPTIEDKQTKSFSLFNFNMGLNTRDADFLIDQRQLSGGQNVGISPLGAITSRLGKALYGETIGDDTTGILGLFHLPLVAGTNYLFAVWNTEIYKYNAGLWVPAGLASPLTTNLPADASFFPSLNKLYLTNATDQVVIMDGSSYLRDANFKKGKYIEWFEDRLMVGNVSSAENRLWYSDADAITFTGAGQYIDFPETITGIIKYYRKLLVFGERKIYWLQNFNFTSGIAAGPEVIVPLPVTFGTIYDRTIRIVNGRVYFLARDEEDMLAIYECDGATARKVSKLISTTMATLSSTLANKAAAGSYGNKYILAVSLGGTVNDRVIVMDTDKRTIDKETGEILPSFLPLYTGISASCFCSFPNSTTGAMELYYGDYSTGRVYKMETGSFDEEVSEEYHAGTDSQISITGATSLRGAQSFQLDNTETVTAVSIYAHKNGGTTTELTVRIETDSSGKPSGTLANANATGTIAAFTTTSSTWKTVDFATPFSLTGSTTYWLVVQHTTEGVGSSDYHWDIDASAPAYASGNAATYNGAAWSAAAGSDAYFMVYTKKDIESFATFKACDFEVPHFDKQLMELYTLSKATSSACTLSLGISTDLTITPIEHTWSIYQTGTATWGGGYTWTTTSKWGSSTSQKIDTFFWPDNSITTSKRFTFRIYNKGQVAWTFYGLMPSYQLIVR